MPGGTGLTQASPERVSERRMSVPYAEKNGALVRRDKRGAT